MQYQTKQAFKKSILTTSIALALSACGSSSSSDLADSADSGSLSFSGTVADGYLVDATVCLDLNDNKVCDEGEPKATSTDGGEFTIEGVTQTQIDLHALVVEIIEGVTVDEDVPGAPIDTAYSMTAPAGYRFVSPLTTMVQQEIDNNEGNNDFDLEDAEASVQAKLGTTLDLSEDFVAAKGEDSAFTEEQKNEFELLHKVAQVTARVLQDNVEAVKTAVDGTDIPFEQVLEMVVGEVLEALATINQEVEQAIDAGGDFDPDAVAESGDVTQETTIDTTTVEDEIVARQAEKEASSANLINLVTTVGINWFEADHDEGSIELYYGSFSHNPETGESSDTEYYYDVDAGSFRIESDEHDDGDYLLTAEGWVNAPDTELITINDDGSINIANATVPSYVERLDADQFNIAGLNISSTLAMAGHEMAWADSVDPIAVFGAGALGFKLTFTNVNNQFRMWDWDCEDPTITGGMCNTVWANVGDSNGETDGPARTLSSLISTSPSNAENVGQITGPQVAWANNASVYAEMLADGHVNYYSTKWSTDGTSSSMLIAEGTWGDENVGDVSLIVMELPPIVIGEGDLDFRDRFIFFTEKDGFVRRGEFIPAGDIDHGEVVFNVTGKEDVIAAFSATHFNALNQELILRHDDKPAENDEDSTSGTAPGSDPTPTPTPTPDSDSDSTQGDGTSNEEQGPAPLVTSLQACEAGDSIEGSATGVVTLSSNTEFDAAVTECGGAQTLLAELIAGKTFVIADQSNETVEFVGTESGSAIIREKLLDGTVEVVEEMAWSITNNKLIIEGVDDGIEYRETIYLIATDVTQALELSLKGFAEEADVTQMDGTSGEIWSDILVEHLPQ